MEYPVLAFTLVKCVPIYMASLLHSFVLLSATRQKYYKYTGTVHPSHFSLFMVGPIDIPQ